MSNKVTINFGFGFFLAGFFSSHDGLSDSRKSLSMLCFKNVVYSWSN